MFPASFILEKRDSSIITQPCLRNFLDGLRYIVVSKEMAGQVNWMMKRKYEVYNLLHFKILFLVSFDQPILIFRDEKL